MLMRAATVVQVLQDLLNVLLQLLVVAAIILSFKFYQSINLYFKQVLLQVLFYL